MLVHYMIYMCHTPYHTAGVEVTCTGNTGHGSAFIKDTAMEKLVSYRIALIRSPGNNS